MAKGRSLPVKDAPPAEVESAKSKTTVSVASVLAAPAAPKPVKKSTEAKEMDPKWTDYWSRRDFKRDPKADIQA